MADRFDQHAVRHRMKLLKDDGDVTLYENREDVPCPACGDAFDRILLTRRESHSFDVAGNERFCVTDEGDRLVVCTHR